MNFSIKETRIDTVMFFECIRKKIIGKPCEGEPHARFEVAGDGNDDTAPLLDPTPIHPAVGRIQPKPRASIMRWSLKKGLGKLWLVTSEAIYMDEVAEQAKIR